MKAFGGCWPTMVTPYLDNGHVDYVAVKKMVEWYISHKADGIFTVCQSSEMFFLDEEEKLELARAVVEFSAGRTKVIASGHTAEDLSEQVDQLGRMAETGVDAVIMISNRIALENEPDHVFDERIADIFRQLPDVTFGLYECPYPYKRLVSADFLSKYAASGNLVCMKDVCCNSVVLAERINAVRGTGMALLDANTATLFDFLANGGDGYSGVMGNFHIDLYRWLFDHFRSCPDLASRVNDFLVVAAIVEARAYPMSAKYHFNLEGIEMNYCSRSKKNELFDENARLEIEALYRLEKQIRLYVE